MKKIIIILIIVVIAGGGVWYFLRGKSVIAPRDKYPATIDRHLKPDDQKRIEGQIADLVKQIGGKRDVAELDLWITLGNYRDIIGDLAGAEAAFTTGTELNAASYVLWANVAGVREERGNITGAEGAYRKAIDLQSNPSIIVKYADFLYNHFSDRTDDYEKVLQNGVSQFGQLPEFIGALAQFYETQGRYDEAISHYRVLVPENPAVKTDIARVEREKEAARK